MFFSSDGIRIINDSPETPDLSIIPCVYHDLAEVFWKEGSGAFPSSP